jgi:hypothetical protein
MTVGAVRLNIQVSPVHFYKDLCLGLIDGSNQKRMDNHRKDRDSEKKQNLFFPFKDYMETIPERSWFDF